MKNLIANFLLLTSLLLLFSNCNKVDIIVPGEEGNVEITNKGEYVIETDNGERGLIIDVRPISHKGYSPHEAKISFPNFSKFDTSLEIDPDVNLAAFRVINDSLSEEEKNSFSKGVMTLVEIYGQEGVLGTYEGNVFIEDSNIPITINTEFDFIPSPVNLNNQVKHLIQYKTKWGTLNTPQEGILTRGPGSMVPFPFALEAYSVEEGIYQGFYFEQVGENRFRIKTPRVCIDTNGDQQDCSDFIGLEWSVQSSGGWIKMIENGDRASGSLIPLDDPSEASTFELVPKENGWMEIYYLDENMNLIPCTVWANNTFIFSNDIPFGVAEIRLIPDNIEYSIEDAGTTYFQPIIPPARSDFAFISTIRNCSNSIIEESVGRSETKTSTVSYSTTESIQLFSQEEVGVLITNGYQTEIGYGGVEATAGIGERRTYSTSEAREYISTTSETISTSNTFESSFETETEVSRVRTISVPAYSGVEVFDFIQNAENLRIPFIKKMRISGINKINNTRLSGLELSSVMEGNLFDGIITKVEEGSIIISLRGSSLVSSVIVASSGANEIENPCPD
ncbi:hypothetical protein OO009_03020 [Flavobacteriaceae bacterium KMM 6897]|nr:hypothetical protein [Flavobacteriaceae bacterium KMM 6897]